MDYQSNQKGRISESKGMSGSLKARKNPIRGSSRKPRKSKRS